MKSFISMVLVVSSFTLHASEVALFFDASFVDTVDEANNLQTTLVNNGDNVTTFTGTVGAFAGPLAGKDILVIPELQNSDLNAALDAPTRTNIYNFVNNGGILVVHGGTTPNDTNFINGVFGYSLTTNGTTSSGTSTLTAAASAGDYSGAPASIDNLSDTTRVLKTAITAIPNSVIVYEIDVNEASVFSVEIGSGKLIFYGWDWWGAAPQGAADGNWGSLYNYVSTNIAAPSVPASGLEW